MRQMRGIRNKYFSIYPKQDKIHKKCFEKHVFRGIQDEKNSIYPIRQKMCQKQQETINQKAKQMAIVTTNTKRSGNSHYKYKRSSKTSGNTHYII